MLYYVVLQYITPTYSYIFCTIFFFPHGTQGLPPRPGTQFCHLPKEAPPAKSGPSSSLYPLHSIVEHRSKKLQGICTADTGTVQSVCMKEVAIAPHRAGGYSLSTNVRNFPSVPWPMLAPLGRLSTTRHAQICCPNVGRFNDRSMVGFAVIAPRSP